MPRIKVEEKSRIGQTTILEIHASKQLAQEIKRKRASFNDCLIANTLEDTFNCDLLKVEFFYKYPNILAKEGISLSGQKYVLLWSPEDDY